MSQAIAPTETPDREVRLTEIPGELRRLRDEAEQYRQRAALEFTRAEAAERRARHAELALEDWRRIAHENAERAGKAEVSTERARQDSADDIRAANLAHELADKLTEERDRARQQYAETVTRLSRVTKWCGDNLDAEQMASLLADSAIGRECRNCEGTGGSVCCRRDEWVDCEAGCFGGRVFR